MNKIIKMLKFIPILVTCSVLIITTGCLSRVHLTIPSISVDAASLSEMQIQKDIAFAAKEKGWTVLEQTANHTKATITVRGRHTATVDIIQTNSMVTINYIGSNGLDYDDKKKIIHSAYNHWVNNLAQSIKGKINYDAALMIK